MKQIDKQPLSVYIHIPFCVRKCEYCDFLSFPGKEELQEEYVQVVCSEIEKNRVLFSKYRIITIFFGGGTPSVIPADLIGRILCELRCHSGMTDSEWADIEISMEANPGTLTKEKLQQYRQHGINRLSLGVQSVKNEELKMLGRIHTREQFLESWQLAREAGFDNINIDLMMALPGQTETGWKETLDEILMLNPEHISAYSLIIEEGTPFRDKYGEGGCYEHLLPEEDAERNMYQYTAERLKNHGYDRYEISNYAQKDKECRHNISYWNGTDYLGIGLGAASYLSGTRYKNLSDMKQYLQQPFRTWEYEEINELSEKEKMEEFMFLGLRMMKGVSSKRFQQHFQKSLHEIYGKTLEQMKENGLMQQDEDMFFLTDKGIDISNYVFTEFLLD